MSLLAIPDRVVWKGIDEEMLKSEVSHRPFRQGQTNFFVKFCCLVNPTSASQRVFVSTPRTQMFRVSPRSSRKVDIQMATNHLGWDIILGPGAEMSFRIELKKPDQIIQVSDNPTTQDWRKSSLNNHRGKLLSLFCLDYPNVLRIRFHFLYRCTRDIFAIHYLICETSGDWRLNPPRSRYVFAPST